jgi:hypothetical protein
MTQVVLPTYSDDSGGGTDGTPFDATFWDSVATAINTLCHSTTNPTVTPEDIIDEVVLARGTALSLDARLDVEHNNDGTHNLPATVASIANLQADLGGVNLIPNDTFLLWSGGDTVAPDYYVLAGSTAARCGTGLVDTTRKVGKFCISLTNAGTLTRTMVDAAAWPAADHLETLKIGFGCWIKSSIASHARIYMTDGSATTYTDHRDGVQDAAYIWHSGGGAFEFLSGVHTVSAAATKLELVLDVASNGTAYFSGLIAILSDHAPVRHQPTRKDYGTLVFAFPGLPVAGNTQRHFCFGRPALIKEVYGTAVTAPVGTEFQIQLVRSKAGDTWNDVYTNDPENLLAVGKKSGTLGEPTGTYAYRCMGGSSLDASVLLASGDDSVLAVNIDTVSSAKDIVIHIRTMQYENPLEDFLAYDDL